MIRNYLKVAIRNLWKNKLFSFINIMGLGLAIPFALMALMQLQGAFEFDNFHPNSERIYRIITDEKNQENGTQHYASSPYLLADNLRNNYASVEKATKVVREFGWELNNQLKNIRVNTIYIEPSFFDIFGFRLAKGSIPMEPNSLILSHETAVKFFNDSNPIGQFLSHPTYGSFKITGVLKPFKRGTQFRSDVMVSMATYEKLNAEQLKPTSWERLETHTFVRLSPNASTQALDVALNEIAKKTNTLISKAQKSNTFRKQKLVDISPSTEKLRNNPYVEDMQDIYFNFTIPLMILLLAGFNYTNLTLARSLSRSKEVGVRKVMGAFRSQLITQFIAEAIVIAFLSLFVGVIILQIIKSSIHVNWVTWEVENQTKIWVLFIAFALFLGILAGSLPAWILSSFQPVKVLKGNVLPASFGKIGFRKVLVVIQFVASLGFIFQIGHLYNQFEYMATENENFNRKGIFNISLTAHNFALLANEVATNKDVEKIGFVSVPFGGISTEYAIKAKDKSKNIASYYYAADANFIENMGLNILAGTNLPKTESDTATNFVLLNEQALKRLHLGTPQEAIGKAIYLNNSSKASQIVGIVKDFCHFNYQFEKQPVVFQYNPAQFHVMVVKTNSNTSKTDFLSDIRRIWKKQNPYQQLSYSWFEQELYERYYPAEDMKMMGMAALVIIVIAVMGLLGMVNYSTEKRTKEIGIRKVMGASVGEIVRILSWSFMKLLIWAGIIAIPIGFAESLVLDNLFTFYAGLNIGLMTIFFICIFCIAGSTIAYYAIRTANLNPVKTLRTE